MVSPVLDKELFHIHPMSPYRLRYCRIGGEIPKIEKDLKIQNNNYLKNTFWTVYYKIKIPNVKYDKN